MIIGRYYNKLLSIGLLLCVALEYNPMETKIGGYQFTRQCEYDTRVLCPNCFPDKADCDFFTNHIVIDRSHPLNVLNELNQHGVTYALLDGKQPVIVKNLNQMGQVEELRDSLCEELNISRANCRLENNVDIILALRRRVLDKEAFGGCIICPPGDERALVRWVLQYTAPELLKLISMKTSVQPAMLEVNRSVEQQQRSFIYFADVF